MTFWNNLNPKMTNDLRLKNLKIIRHISSLLSFSESSELANFKGQETRKSQVFIEQKVDHFPVLNFSFTRWLLPCVWGGGGRNDQKMDGKDLFGTTIFSFCNLKPHEILSVQTGARRFRNGLTFSRETN